MSDLLSGLNEPQQKAVTATEGPFLVLAGAGSGKTMTLTHRIAYLVDEKKISPYNILAVTFTNKAAGEMRTRVMSLLKKTTDRPLIGTFHSVCMRILRDDIHNLGYENNFNIVDAYDQRALVKRICVQQNLDEKQFAPRAVAETISRAKNHLRDAATFADSVDSYYEEQVASVYTQYQSTLKQNNALDFDDLIRLTITLFQQHPVVLEKYQERFRYILVDEYQDTNQAQYLLISLLAKKHGNLFVVGDDWQSVYLWRGADMKKILTFEKDYPHTTVIKLEQNYRSTQNILDAAFSVIEHNNERSDKKIWTDQGSGEKIISYEAQDESDEALFVANTIQAAVEHGERAYKDFVVLYRTNAQSRQIEEGFLFADIPYRIVGGTKFYERKEIKDILSYLRIIDNPRDTLSLIRAVGEPKRGIGQKTLADWLASVGEDESPLTVPIPEKVSAKKQLDIAAFCELIERFRVYSADHSLAELISHVYSKSGYEKALNDGTMEGEMRHENVQELLTVAKNRFGDAKNASEILPDFLGDVALAADTDNIAEQENSVHLMTLHSAKGLEFPVVFIAGCEEGLLPHSRATLNNAEMEEERRLMYVGITRAKEKAYMLFALRRMLFGQSQVNAPSRFLDDIPDALIEQHEEEFDESTLHRTSSHFFNAPYKKKSREEITKNTPTKKFTDGDKVKHTTFGEGIVVGQDDETISIVFKGVGLKKLDPTIAPLEKM